MGEPRSSMWVVFILGIAGVGLVMVMMLVPITELEATSAGTRAKLANTVTGAYTFDSLVLEFQQDEEAVRVITVRYETRKELGFDAEAEQAEMRGVAELLAAECQKYGDPEVAQARRIAVTRLELRGSGCFQSRYESAFTLDLPERRRESRPPPPFRPPPPPDEKSD